MKNLFFFALALIFSYSLSAQTPESVVTINNTSEWNEVDVYQVGDATTSSVSIDNESHDNLVYVDQTNPNFYAGGATVSTVDIDNESDWNEVYVSQAGEGSLSEVVLDGSSDDNYIDVVQGADYDFYYSDFSISSVKIDDDSDFNSVEVFQNNYIEGGVNDSEVLIDGHSNDNIVVVFQDQAFETSVVRIRGESDENTVIVDQGFLGLIGANSSVVRIKDSSDLNFVWVTQYNDFGTSDVLIDNNSDNNSVIVTQEPAF